MSAIWRAILACENLMLWLWQAVRIESKFYTRSTEGVATHADFSSQAFC
jgi:hypothetical protein